MSLVKEEEGESDSSSEARRLVLIEESDEEIDDQQENDETDEFKRREISFDKNPTMVSKYVRDELVPKFLKLLDEVGQEKKSKEHLIEPPFKAGDIFLDKYEVIDFLRKTDDQSVYVVQTKEGIKYELHVELFQDLITSVSREQAFLVSAMQKSCAEYFGGRIVDVGMQDVQNQFLRYYVQKKNETSIDLDIMLLMLVGRSGAPDIGFVQWVLFKIVKVLTYAYHCGCVVKDLEMTMFAYDPVSKVLRLKDLSAIATKGVVFPPSGPTKRVKTKEEQFEQDFVRFYINSVRLAWQEMFRLAHGYNVSSDIIERTFKAIDKMIKQNLKQVNDLHVMDPEVAKIMHPWLFQIVITIQKATLSVETMKPTVFKLWQSGLKKLINKMSGVTQEALFDILKPIFNEVGLTEAIDAAEKTNFDEAIERARNERIRTAQLKSIDEHRERCLMREHANRLKKLRKNYPPSDEYREEAIGDRGPFDVPIEELSIVEAKGSYFTYAYQKKMKSKTKYVDYNESEESVEDDTEEESEDSSETESHPGEPATKIRS